MNPFSLFTRPVRDIAGAVLMPLKALWVVGLTGLINWMTYSGTWWFKWVAFGMGIAVLVAWARAAKTLLLLGLVSFVGWQVYKRRRYDEWVARSQPHAAQLLQTLRGPSAV
jgi:hypothetical protein